MRAVEAMATSASPPNSGSNSASIARSRFGNLSAATVGSAERNASISDSIGPDSGRLVAPRSTRTPRASNACTISSARREIPAPSGPSIAMTRAASCEAAAASTASSAAAWLAKSGNLSRSRTEVAVSSPSPAIRSTAASPRTIERKSACVSGIGSTPISACKSAANRRYSAIAPARSPASKRTLIRRRTTSSRHGSDASIARAHSVASACARRRRASAKSRSSTRS